jgi:hypothetical protein
MIRFGIGYHPCLIANAYCFHDGCEWLRRQEQVSHSSLICPTQIGVPIEMNGPWKMPVLVELAT